MEGSRGIVLTRSEYAFSQWTGLYHSVDFSGNSAANWGFRSDSNRDSRYNGLEISRFSVGYYCLGWMWYGILYPFLER